MKTLLQKLANIHKGIIGFNKDAKGYQFNYVSSNVVLSNVRALMQEEGVLLIPTIKQANLQILDGKMPYFTEIWTHYIWVNVDDKEDTIECDFYGQGIDNGEKGVGKAATYSEKYFLLKFFQIPTDSDDPDANQVKPKTQSKAPPKETQRDSNPATDEEIDWSAPKLRLITDALNAFTSLAHMEAWITENTPNFQTVSPAWQTKIRDVIAKQRETLK